MLEDRMVTKGRSVRKIRLKQLSATENTLKTRTTILRREY